MPRLSPKRLALLPNSFFPSDSGRRIGAPPSRRDAGLPEEAFVFCCFNNSWKITAPVFARWMRLLGQIPGSVLWLKQTGAKTKANLLAAAQGHGIAPERLVFAEPAALEVHLARHRLADLFLDTAALWRARHGLRCAVGGSAGADPPRHCLRLARGRQPAHRRGTAGTDRRELGRL